ncbi:hypothetical protein [Actinophytocola glycyrrhizae]|uniref:ParB family chromosome partitioning protein n=1 Tax=Actinophytocola glycyrrhizae TaxID=2044873 RepID=A0ABV9SEW2_9PSEU
MRAPILAYRDESGDLVVLEGQMRTLQAVEAGRAEVPVWVQPPPAADEKTATIDRIINQLGENDHRTPMTRGDVYQAYQQLRLLGLSATAIARRRSRPKRVVEDSLRVGDSELAAKAADKYDLTLEQAAVIAEFEDLGDLETAKELILTAVEKPANFAVLAQRKRDDRVEAERFQQAEAALVEQLTAAGVTIFDDSIPEWTGQARVLNRLRPTPEDEPGTELTAEAHADCPGDGAWIFEGYDDNDQRIPVARYGCADFRAHGHALSHAPAGQVEYGSGTATTLATTGASDNVTTDGTTDDGLSELARAELEREKARIERRWVIQNNKDMDAATKVRHEWLANFARRSSAPKFARKWLAQQKLNGSYDLRRAMERGHRLAHKLLKLPEPGYGQVSGLIEKIENASEPKATVWDMYLTLAAQEEGFQRNAWRSPSTAEKEHMSMMILLGHQAHDVERKVVTAERIEDVIAANLPPHLAPPVPVDLDDLDDLDEAAVTDDTLHDTQDNVTEDHDMQDNGDDQPRDVPDRDDVEDLGIAA